MDVSCLDQHRVTAASNITPRDSSSLITIHAEPAKSTPVSEPPAPVLGGYLHLQKITTGEWKKWWCEFNDGILTWRKDSGAVAVAGRILVCFFDAELVQGRYTPLPVVHEEKEPKTGPEVRPSGTRFAVAKPSTPSLPKFSLSRTSSQSSVPQASSPLLEPTERERGSSPSDNGKVDELYYSCLGNLASTVFKVFAPARTYVFRAETTNVRDDFCNAFYEWLKLHMDEAMHRRKLQALKDLSQIMREQFVLHDSQCHQLIQALAGFVEEEPAITSTKKGGCGVLSMEVGTEGVEEWKDYYFVLFEGHWGWTLFYYKDSKHTKPTGFLALKHASVSLDPTDLARGDIKFEVRTPLRTLVLRAKHPVALTEWIACLDTALNSMLPKKKGAVKRSSQDVLNYLNRVIGRVITWKDLPGFPLCLTMFKETLGEQGTHEYDFLMAMYSLRNSKLSGSEKDQRAAALHRDFIATQAPGTPTKVAFHFSVSGSIRLDCDVIEEAVQSCERHLETAFAGFRATPVFETMSFFGESPVVQTPTRKVDAFGANMQLSFLVKRKDQKKSSDVPLLPKNTVLTIGRDPSNQLVIDDSRVSRSHARVEYTPTQCEYIDLGSSCGSKLNGKPVLRVRLQPGDVLEIGHSTLIFQVAAKKPRFAFLHRSKGTEFS